MAQDTDYIMAFWDMKSIGTKHMIDYSKKLNKPILIVDYINRSIVESWFEMYRV